MNVEHLTSLLRVAFRRTMALTGLIALSAALALTGCNSNARTATTASESNATTIKPVMTFNPDTAYNYIATQLDFGPRVPGTEGNKKCGEWIAGELLRHGADTVMLQHCTAMAHNGDVLPLTNIMGRFGVTGQPRVLLVAHYDTRPWADREHVHENLSVPIPGANDGGSGVGVLLELARLFGQKRPEIGVDILLVDGEDYGKSDGWSNNDSTWCLGSQYWAEHMPADYRTFMPRYGILLDMVGGKHARFMREFLSDRYAPDVLDKVWQIADASGYGNYFVNRRGGSVIDDHMFISGAGIPTIDIVDCNNGETDNFPCTWHTLSDNLENIDQEVLMAVGQTVANVVYREHP